MAATTLCNHSGELEIVQLYHGHGRNSDNTPKFFFLSVLMKESLPLFIDFKEGRIQTGSESQTEFGFLRLLKILEKMMNLFNSRDLLNFIHPLFPTIPHMKEIKTR